MDILEPTKEFNFSNLCLSNPQTIQGGSSYFTKIALTNIINKDKSLYIQLPKCKTRQGIVTTKKEKYCDLLFEKNGTQETDELFEWIYNLEKKCQALIDSKKTLWFHNDITLEDIENMMIPVCRLYKSGKNILIRSFIDVIRKTGHEKCLAYDERENIVALDNIKESQYIIPLLLVDGIIFSTKSFEISIKMVQLMVCDDVTERCDVSKCLIKPTVSRVENKKEQIETKESSDCSSLTTTKTLPETPSETLITSSSQTSIETSQDVTISTQAKETVESSQQTLEISPSTSQIQTQPQDIESSETVLKKDSDKTNNVGEIEEFQVDFNNVKETVIIKSAHDIYKNLIIKTNELKKKYTDALLVAKKFKEKYKLKDNSLDLYLSEEEEEEYETD